MIRLNIKKSELLISETLISRYIRQQKNLGQKVDISIRKFRKRLVDEIEDNKWKKLNG